VIPIELDNSSNFYAFPQLSIAVESLVYLQDVLNSLRPHIETLLPKQNVNFVNSFFEQSVASVADLRTLCYEGFCDRIIPVLYIVLTISLLLLSSYENVFRIVSQSEPLVKAVEACKWDIKEIPIEHNSYVSIPTTT
jgi:hypothetical protein